MVAAPAVVAALAVGRESPSEVTAGKGGNALGEIGIAMKGSDLIHGALEGVHTLAQLGEQVGMGAIKDGTANWCVGLSAVKIVAADLAEEYLAPHAEADGRRPVPGFDKSGDHLELRPEGRIEFGAAGRGDYLKGPRSRERRGPKLCRWRGRGIGGSQDRSIQQGTAINGVVSDARVG